MKIDWNIDAASTGLRLDFLVSKAVAGCSRSMAAAWIRQGNIRVSGHQKQPGYRVKKADMITGTIPPPGLPPPVDPEPGPVHVVIDSNRDPIVYGYGYGLRTQIFGYFVRLDWAWGIENRTILPRIFYFSLNLDF